MGKYDDVKKEIELLLEQGINIYNEYAECLTKDKQSDLLHNEYELWYTKSLYLVRQLAFEREGDFISCYKLEKRKNIEFGTYVISDLLQGMKNSSGLHKIPFLLRDQINILKSCYEKFDSKVFDLEMLLQADVFDSEVESARHLLKNGFLRAAGAICGVVLEKHLAKVCKNRGITIIKKDPSISDYNDKLKDVAYDLIEWRKMQSLADIRNLCGHEKHRDPTKDEVEELINGTNRVIKNIF